MSIRTIQDNLRKGDPIGNYSTTELKYLEKPLGKNIYKHATEEQQDEYKRYLDKVKCKVCGKITSRCNQSQHKKSQYHMAHERMNKKIREVLLD
jgi:hypothetical protein